MIFPLFIFAFIQLQNSSAALSAFGVLLLQLTNKTSIVKNKQGVLVISWLFQAAKIEGPIENAHFGIFHKLFSETFNGVSKIIFMDFR